MLRLMCSTHGDLIMHISEFRKIIHTIQCCAPFVKNSRQSSDPYSPHVNDTREAHKVDLWRYPAAVVEFLGVNVQTQRG